MEGCTHSSLGSRAFLGLSGHSSGSCLALLYYAVVLPWMKQRQASSEEEGKAERGRDAAFSMGASESRTLGMRLPLQGVRN